MLNLQVINDTLRSLSMSQAALAERCHVSREAVSNWLSGESHPRPMKLKAIAETLGLEVKSLLQPNLSNVPVVAYRTKKKEPATDSSMVAAVELAVQLRQLVPFAHSPYFSPAWLDCPRVDHDYVYEVTQRLRNKLGLSKNEPISRDQLLDLHHEFGSILVPVRWDGDRTGHENALSVYLPDSKSSWVVFSLNARNDDFNYWLAHELGHCYSLPMLVGDEGEDFAELFAQELLFPTDAANTAVEEIFSHPTPILRAHYLAEAYNISIVTVVKQTERMAAASGRKFISLQTESFWKEWNETRDLVPTVARALFGGDEVSVDQYVEISEMFFKTPIFTAISKWQQQEDGRSPAFISSVLNVDLEEAVELSHLLMKRVHSQSVGAPSLKSSQ
jgi:transcriptional regulator with XRE-family HTH domain/Zn-dependent peptidase ImmA (M78 family)